MENNIATVVTEVPKLTWALSKMASTHPSKSKFEGFVLLSSLEMKLAGEALQKQATITANSKRMRRLVICKTIQFNGIFQHNTPKMVLSCSQRWINQQFFTPSTLAKLIEAGHFLHSTTSARPSILKFLISLHQLHLFSSGISLFHLW